MQVSPEKPLQPEVPLQLLLFVDERPSSRQQVERLRLYLKQLQDNYQFELQIVDVGEQPYLAEHFKLVATPALIKIYPEPRQVLAGSNLTAQLKNWWPRWQNAVKAKKQFTACSSQDDNHYYSPAESAIRSVADSAEVLRLTDEIFNLKREKEQLLEQLQFRDRAIAMLVHDLRNPLTAVSIAIETLEANYTTDKTPGFRLKPALALQLFKQARAQTRTIDQMITSLLQANRNPNLQQLHIQPQKLELKAICQDVIAQVSELSSLKSQKLLTDIPQDLPYLYGDQELIQQVLINLLDNAIKYTPESGIIRISGLHRTTQKVQVSVCDTGPGIPEDQREQIFTEYFRLERDEAKEGYGLGLALCRRIIQAHCGQIWVESTPKGGSCFHFTLPVYPS